MGNPTEKDTKKSDINEYFKNPIDMIKSFYIFENPFLICVSLADKAIYIYDYYTTITEKKHSLCANFKMDFEADSDSIVNMDILAVENYLYVTYCTLNCKLAMIKITFPGD